MAATMTESMLELQKAADSIREGLKVVNDDIKKLTGRDPAEFRTPVSRRVQLKRNFNQQRDLRGPASKRLSQDGGGRRWGRTVVASRIKPVDKDEDVDSSGEEEVLPHKSAVQSSIVATVKTPDMEIKPKAEDRTTQQRNKRMFGLLLGTLKKFKDDDKVRSEKEKKREAIEKKLDEQAQKEKADIASQKKELFLSRRQKQLELRKLEHKMEIAELKTEIESHNNMLKRFIRLNSSPTIYYLPKIHNERTEELLAGSREIIEEAQRQRFKEMDLSDDDFDTKEQEQKASLSSVVANANEVSMQTNGNSRKKNEIETRSPQENPEKEVSSTVENGEYDQQADWGEKMEVKVESSSETVEKEGKDNDQESYVGQQSFEQIDAHELLERLG